MKLDKHVVDMFTELTKPADDVKMEKTCYGTISVVDGTRYVKLDGSDLLVPAASTVKTSHGDRVTVLMKNHSLTVTGNLTAPATDGEGGSSGESGTAATIEVGTVTTGEAGSSATVTNVGTTSAAVFDFVIPKGDKGEKGDTGPQGPQGEKGDTGTWDGTIPDHEHTVSDITDFPTSLPANGGNADTVDGKHSYEITPYHPVNDRPYSTLTARIENVGNAVFKTILRYNDGTINAAAKFAAIADGGNAETLDGLHANEIASNPNLLMNPDFKINQRGLSTYSGTRGYYCVDGWYKNAETTINVVENGVTMNYSGTTNPSIYQRIEQVKKYLGKTLTLSALINNEIYSCTGTLPKQITAATTYVAFARLDHTEVRPESQAVPHIRLQITSGGNFLVVLNNVPNCEWAKLELGTIATPFVPPDPATELAKCQRYFIRLKNAFGWIGSGFTNKTLARCVIPLPTTMRISPTVTLNGKIYANTPTSLGARAIECTTVRSDISYTQNVIGVSFDLPEGSTSMEPCFMQFRDSESYIDISAEL